MYVRFVKIKLLLISDENNCSPSQAFAYAFPMKYLPKKKRAQLEKTGKQKVPAVGTSDKWMMLQKQKEDKQKLKEEKAQKRKILQEEKKKVTEEKKKLQNKWKEIQDQLKKEK